MSVEVTSSPDGRDEVFKRVVGRVLNRFEVIGDLSGEDLFIGRAGNFDVFFIEPVPSTDSEIVKWLIRLRVSSACGETPFVLKTSPLSAFLGPY